jgi:hypothetical protein
VKAVRWIPGSRYARPGMTKKGRIGGSFAKSDLRA